MQDRKFYITTPIYYVTAQPHLGSLYSTLLADVLARWNKLQGKKVFFLTGTDEHGQKVADAAQRAGKDPKVFVDSFIDAYKRTWALYDIAYDCFIRTTEKRHVKAVQQWIQQLIEKGDIYKSEYEGWYCVPCETFITDTEVADQRAHNKEPQCSSCFRVIEKISEESYFFRLSAYQDRLLDFYNTHPDFIIPQAKAHEIINFVSSGLKDISISRKTVSWGIPFAHDDAHVAYVWADALNNYITAIGYAQEDAQDAFNFWWPADVHVLGKDIARFHAIYWPAFLMASDLELPKQLLVHGWITVDQSKMSKSLGNVVDPVELSDRYGAQEIRYYLMRYMSVTHDSNFSFSDVERAITSDLANDLGNLINRMSGLAEKHGVVSLQDPEVWSASGLEIMDASYNCIQDVSEYMQERLMHMALGRIWKFIHQMNAYFHAQEPWRIAKSDHAQFLEVLSVTCHALRVIATLLWPFMPITSEKILQSIGVKMTIEENHNSIEDLALSWKGRSFMLHKIAALFKKYEPESSKPEEQVKPQKDETFISIDDVAKVELRVGTIQACEEVPKSEKLLKMQVNFGSDGVRQILAGIKSSYTPKDLINKQAIFVVNLKPRKMMGIESQGMLLISKDADGRLHINSPAVQVPDGTRLS